MLRDQLFKTVTTVLQFKNKLFEPRTSSRPSRNWPPGSKQSDFFPYFPLGNYKDDHNDDNNNDDDDVKSIHYMSYLGPSFDIPALNMFDQSVT